jgi:N-acetylmuramate 1-kinase
MTDLAQLAQTAISEMENVTPYDLLVHRMGGDASDRSYHRVTYGAFGELRSVVMMKLADTGPFIKSEEVTLYHDEAGELPFLNIHRFLESIGAPVPKVLFRSVDRLGVLLLEDLGDTLLLDVAHADPENAAWLYRRAIELMVYLHLEGTRRLTNDCVATKQAFSTELLLWEFRHFVEYGIEERQGELPAEEKARLDEVFLGWAEHLAGLPRVLTHRDFHARNLMVRGDNLVLIDFQDALLGPATYDLASLVRDSYFDLGWETVDALVEHYLNTWERRRGPEIDRKAFLTDLWATALQRNLKAAGRFVFIERVKGKPGYEKDIPRTLSYLAGYVERAPQLGPLVEALRPHTPELA